MDNTEGREEAATHLDQYQRHDEPYQGDAQPAVTGRPKDTPESNTTLAMRKAARVKAANVSAKRADEASEEVADTAAKTPAKKAAAAAKKTAGK